MTIGLAGKMESWNYGFMKTTLDLPVDLVRAMKVQAAQEGRILRDVATEIFRRGMSRPTASKGKTTRHRVKLPIVAVTPGAAPFDLSGARIHELEMAAEMERHDASLRR